MERLEKGSEGNKYPPPDPETKSLLLEYVQSYMTINDFGYYTKDIRNRYSKYPHVIEMSSFADGAIDDDTRISLGLPKSRLSNNYFIYATCTIKIKKSTKVLLTTLIIEKNDPKILSIITKRSREKKLNQIL